jgi:hypothetical protein
MSAWKRNEAGKFRTQGKKTTGRQRYYRMEPGEQEESAQLWGNEKCIQIYSREIERIDRLGDVGVDARVLSKWMSE